MKSVVVLSQQKLWELAKQVSEFLVWRQVICPFDRDRRILQYLVTTPVFSEDGQLTIFSAFISSYINHTVCHQVGKQIKLTLSWFLP